MKKQQDFVFLQHHLSGRRQPSLSVYSPGVMVSSKVRCSSPVWKRQRLLVHIRKKQLSNLPGANLAQRRILTKHPEKRWETPDWPHQLFPPAPLYSYTFSYIRNRFQAVKVLLWPQTYPTPNEAQTAAGWIGHGVVLKLGGISQLETLQAIPPN